jgi:O-antigen biosynthesis protein WbqP
VTKRVFDVVAGILMAIIAAPIILVLAVLIRRQSVGPGIFAQERVGRHQEVFTCYKLRTMASDTGNLPSHHVSSMAITPIGKMLRKTKLDELPQLYNVIRGDMSFVGPRPCLPSQTELIAERATRGVYALRPGITGLAQINKVDMSEPQRLAEFDARYVKTANFGFDLKILILTLLGSGLASDAAHK